MKKTYEKPKLQAIAVKTEAIADSTSVLKAAGWQSEYKTLNITSKTVSY